MPPKVPPQLESFLGFEDELEKRGFRRLGEIEARRTGQRLGLVAPRKREGKREVGFEFVDYPWRVVVWTTWLLGERRVRDIDAGWVLIKKGDFLRYVAGPFHRTKNFFPRLLREARLARMHVTHRPLCSECEADMYIACGKAMKARYWRCDKVKQHPSGKPVSIDWDFGLPPLAKEFAKKRRKSRAIRRAKVRAQGKDPYAALRRRKLWGMRRPENVQG